MGFLRHAFTALSAMGSLRSHLVLTRAQRGWAMVTAMRNATPLDANGTVATARICRTCRPNVQSDARRSCSTIVSVMRSAMSRHACLMATTAITATPSATRTHTEDYRGSINTTDDGTE